jgi:hypothetical protein
MRFMDLYYGWIWRWMDPYIMDGERLSNATLEYLSTFDRFNNKRDDYFKQRVNVAARVKIAWSRTSSTKMFYVVGLLHSHGNRL